MRTVTIDDRLIWFAQRTVDDAFETIVGGPVDYRIRSFVNGVAVEERPGQFPDDSALQARAVARGASAWDESDIRAELGL